MVGLIAGLLMAVGYTADAEKADKVTADKRYPESYAAFKKGFVPAFERTFSKRTLKAPSEALVDDFHCLVHPFGNFGWQKEG